MAWPPPARWASTGRRRAQPFRGIRFVRRGRSGGSRVSRKGRGLGMRRTALHDLMVERAAGAGVRWLGRARYRHGGGGACTAWTAAWSRARWIVGADGGHSRVRRWAGLR